MGANDPSNRESVAEGILHPEGMRAARDLAVGVVHEINNVLGVIIGNVHLAKKNLGDVSALERYLREVRDAAEEGREVMRQLAQLSADRDRVPEAPQVLPARRTGADTHQLRVVLADPSLMISAVGPVIVLPDPSRLAHRRFLKDAPTVLCAIAPSWSAFLRG